MVLNAQKILNNKNFLLNTKIATESPWLFLCVGIKKFNLYQRENPLIVQLYIGVQIIICPSPQPLYCKNIPLLGMYLLQPLCDRC